MEKLNQLKAVLEASEADFKKFFEGGSGAAGTRVRKAMQDIKNLAQEIRTEVTEMKNQDKAEA